MLNLTSSAVLNLTSRPVTFVFLLTRKKQSATHVQHRHKHRLLWLKNRYHRSPVPAAALETIHAQTDSTYVTASAVIAMPRRKGTCSALGVLSWETLRACSERLLAHPANNWADVFNTDGTGSTGDLTDFNEEAHVYIYKIYKRFADKNNIWEAAANSNPGRPGTATRQIPLIQTVATTPSSTAPKGTTTNDNSNSIATPEPSSTCKHADNRFPRQQQQTSTTPTPTTSQLLPTRISPRKTSAADAVWAAPPAPLRLIPITNLSADGSPERTRQVFCISCGTPSLLSHDNYCRKCRRVLMVPLGPANGGLRPTLPSTNAEVH